MQTIQTKTNAEIVQQCYADFGSGNIEGLLTALRDDIVWMDPGYVGNLYAGRREGKASVREFFGVLSGEITITRFDIRSLSESGDKVFAEGYLEARGNKSGLMTKSDWIMVWQLQHGKVKYHHLYLDTLALSVVLQNQDNF